MAEGCCPKDYLVDGGIIGSTPECMLDPFTGSPTTQYYIE